MRRKLRAGTPIIALVFIGIAALFIASCTTDEVEIPDLTGPSGARLFINIEASPDKVFIKGPNQPPDRSNIVIQLRNQLGQGVPNARIVLRLTNIEGSEVAIGSLDRTVVTTDSGGFARVTYTAPSTDFQPANTTVVIRAILADPAFPFEVVTIHPLDLELTRPFDCVAGPGAPEINFTVNPAAPAEDEQVCFDAQTTVDNGSIVSFTWSFGDGGTASGVFVCHTFTNNGSFPVTLFVVDNDANCVSLTKLVVVGEGAGPTCAFTLSPNPVSTDTQVIFDASTSEDTDGNIVSFQWDFGDGQSANGETVTHSYNFTGTFTVTLTIRDNAGNEAVCTQTVTVGTGFPTCDFDVDPTNPNTNEQVTFDGSNSEDPEGGTLTFAWNFGDGNTASGEVVAHAFTSEGSFLVTLTVTDPEGNATSCSQAVVVGSVPPECAFTASPSAADVGDTVNFNASSSSDDGTITNFAWDFGDGNTLDPNTDPTVSHVYEDNGTFLVTLTLTDNDGNTTTCTQTVTIGNSAPLCTFSAAPNSGSPPLAVAFDASGSTDQDEGGASIVRFDWDFGDGNTESNTTPTTTHTYDQTGNFTAELIVTDDEGGSSTCTRTITTTGAIPTAAFTATPPSGSLDNEDDPILFDASSSSDNDELGQSIVQYQWDFNDGSAVVTTANPQTTHTFANPGSFSVTLTVTDDEGQTDTENQNYVVDSDL